jgi:predicted ATPase
MITSIRLHNFKCFADELLPLSALTVLSGINGMGKSSVLQSFLLLRQSYISENHKLAGALLNGPLISLGTAEDVLYENAQSDATVSFRITLDNAFAAEWSFSYKKNCEILPLASSKGKNDKLSEHALFNPYFAYLKAERIGPRTSFAIADHELAKYNPLGNAGEYCAHILSRRERHPLPIAGLVHNNEKLNELRAQTEAWLTEIGQNPRIHLQEYFKMDLVNLEFSFVRDGLPSMNYRPTNVGFGLTYSLPIFVATLASVPGSLILIENPEAHLHPRGQVAIGKFLALAAANGIQIIIETHSDHVLNGIRIAVKNKTIEPDNVTLHFFDRSKEAPCCSVTTPKIDKDGRLDQWPEGFFDEWEKGLAELL